MSWDEFFLALAITFFILALLTDRSYGLLGILFIINFVLSGIISIILSERGD